MDETKSRVVGLVQQYSDPIREYDVNNYYSGGDLYTAKVTLPEQYNSDFFDGKLDEFIEKMQILLKDIPVPAETVAEFKSTIALARSVQDYVSQLDQNVNIINGCVREMSDAVKFPNKNFRKAHSTAVNNMMFTKSVLKDLDARAQKEIDK